MSQPVLIGEIRLAEIIDRLAPFDPRSFKEKNGAEQMTYWHERHAALETIGAALRYGELPAHVRDDDQGLEYRVPKEDWWGLSRFADCIATSTITAGDHENLRHHNGATVFVREADVDKWLAKVHPDAPPISDVYLSPFMLMMLNAITLFGITAEDFPKKQTLEEYFLGQKLPDGRPVSPNQADSMATFCRPFEAMKGGNKRVG